MTMEKMRHLLSRRLRSLLLGHLGAGLSSDVDKAEKDLASFFNFGIECVKESFLENVDILTLFEDLYECCPETFLTALFPLFERAILGSKADGSDKM